MNANPYAPPSVPQGVSNPSTGIFRDKDSLVVDLSNYHFAPVCLKTGSETDGTYELKDQVLAKSTRILAWVLAGAIGYSIARKQWGRPITLTLPLDTEWMTKVTKAAKMSWKWVYIGIGLIFLGIILSVFHPALAIFCMVGMILSIGSLIVAYFKNRTKDVPFFMSDLNGNWVWIEGVNSELLAGLPSLPHGNS